MKFNWIIADDMDDEFRKFCVDLEYKLRPRITKFLMSRFDEECCEDFSCFHFDLDLINMTIRISEKTPQHYVQRMYSDFEQEISQSCCS